MCCTKVLVFVVLSCVAAGIDLPSNFQKCKRLGSELNGCLKSAIQDSLPKLANGLPDFNLPPTEPLNVPSMTIGEGKGAVHVTQKFTNVNIYGVISANVENIDFQLKKEGFDLVIEAFVPEIRLEADYEFDGQILVVPIVGKGPAVIVLKNVKGRVNIRAEEFEKNGQKYYKIDDLKLNLKPENIMFSFKNLFNGDERLGPEMNKLLNDNSQLIWEDVGAGYEEAIALVLKNVGNLIFRKVPHEILLP